MSDTSVVPKKAKKAVRFITRDDHRLYIHPQTGAFIPGVTSTLNNLPKPFLKPWGQKLVAEEAVKKVDQLNRIVSVDPETAVQWLKQAPDRFTKHAQVVGKVSHAYFEDLYLGNTVSTKGQDPDVIAIVDHFKDFLDTIQPEPILLEEGVYDEELDYAGTFDAILRFNRPDLYFTDSFGNERPLTGIAWADNKTTRSGVHPEVGLQLAAYRYAKYLIREDGSLAKNNPGDFAVVVHVRPEGWELVPVEAGPEEFEVFKTLRKVTDYTMHHEKNIIHPVLAGNRPRRKKRAGSAEKTVAEVTK